MSDDKDDTLISVPPDADSTILQGHSAASDTLPFGQPESAAASVPASVSANPDDRDSTVYQNPSPLQSPDTPSVTSREIHIGSIINNRFIIDTLLGRGGMGVVYRALDKRKKEARDHDPYVAIKILSDEFKHHPQAFVALQREARKSQTLAHPNIITVYDFDRDGDVVYMTMEELGGTTLEQLIKDHPRGVSPKSAQKIIKAIAQGLAYAHSKQIVHSDLKPGNIFVGDNGTVKILDFGIARAVSNISETSGDKTVFDAGEMGGLTPAYASNEMFLGEEPHTSDDVYALGLVSYELLTGSHPYHRKPANAALAEGRKPDRIKGLKNHQWRTIASAIELQRAGRTADAALFLKKFEGMAKTTKALAASLVAVIIILGSITIFRPPASGPDIAFEELAPAMQTKITQALSDGQQALKFGDYNGALFHYNNAYQLHPKNPEAVDGLDTVIEKVFDSADASAGQNGDQQRLRRINTLLEYPALSEHEGLLKMKGRLEKTASD